MKVPKRPRKIYFKNGREMYSIDLAKYLAVAVFQLQPEEIIHYIDRGLTTRTALQQLLLFYNEEVEKREEWERNINL